MRFSSPPYSKSSSAAYVDSSITDTRGVVFLYSCSEQRFWHTSHSLGSCYLRTIVRIYVTQMVQKIGQLLVTALLIKRVWLFSGVSQRIETLAHITCCSFGSNYSKTVELSSPKINAQESQSSPRLVKKFATRTNFFKGRKLS